MRIDGVGVPYDGSVTESKFANPDSVHAFAMGRQALINGNFDVWQRGTSFTNTAVGAYTADRFSPVTSLATLPANVVHSRLTLNPSDIFGSFYGYRITVDGAGAVPNAGSWYWIQQYIENGVRYLSGAGKKVTISFYARSSIPNKRIGIQIAQFYGTGGSPSNAAADMAGTNFTLTSSWQRYTHTLDTATLNGIVFGTNNNDTVILRMFLMWGTGFGGAVGSPGVSETFLGAGTIDIAQVQLCSGEVAMPYDPRTVAEELELCQRYYETSYNTNVAPGTATSVGSILTSTSDNTAGGSTYNTVEFKELKRAVPTVTIYGTDGTINTVNDGGGDRTMAGGFLAEDIGEYGFNQNYTLNGSTGPARKFHFVADAEQTAF